MKKAEIEEAVRELNEGYDPYEIREALIEHNDLSTKKANKVMIEWAKDIIRMFS